jgi:hypothetical protein
MIETINDSSAIIKAPKSIINDKASFIPIGIILLSWRISRPPLQAFYVLASIISNITGL